MNKFYLFIIPILGLFAVSCNDNYPNEPTTPPQFDLESGSSDVTRGINHKIFYTNDTDYSLYIGAINDIVVTHKSFIPLSTSQVTSGVDVGDMFDIEFKTEEGKEGTSRYIVFKPLVEAKYIVGAHQFLITPAAKSRSSLSEKLITVTFRSPEAEPEAVDVEYARQIGKGTLIVNRMGNTTLPILDFNTISSRLKLTENSVQALENVEFTSETHQKSVKSLALEVGADGSANFSKYGLQGSFNFSNNTEATTTSDYEYHIDYLYKNMAEIQLDEAYMTNLGVSSLDETANNVLNNPGTREYELYPNTEEGIYRLFDDYGTHIITKGTFGGYYMYVYCREQNSFEKIVAYDVSAALSFSRTNLIKKILGASPNSELSTEVDTQYYSESYQEASKALEVTVVAGGGAQSDVDLWDQSINESNKEAWVLVKYRISSDPKASDEDHSGLLSIARFTIDPERKAAIEMYLESYLEKLAPTDRAQSDLVIVDFMMKNYDHSKDEHPDGQPNSFVDKDPWGIYRIYYPMMANNYSLINEEKGYALESAAGEYIAGGKSKEHYWYYALAKRSEGRGVTDIVFAKENDKEKPEGFTKRGDNANDGIGLLLDNRYTWVKTAGADNSSQFITAVGLMCEWAQGTPIATSGGAEMSIPLEGENGDFIDFWGDQDLSWTGGERSGKEGYTFYEGGVHKDLRPRLSTKHLYRDFTGEVNRVNHPKKWGSNE